LERRQPAGRSAGSLPAAISEPLRRRLAAGAPAGKLPALRAVQCPRVPEQIDCIVERVTFHNAENGFSVLRVRPRGGNAGIVTVVGNTAALSEGERIVAHGDWREDRTHGRQFVATSIAPQPMQGRVQIEAFLGSGAIKGVGPSTAKLMLAQFGDQILDILEKAPERLREIPGIGPTRAKSIGESWAAQRSTRELMLFLADSGIGVARAGRIQKQFGANAVRLIQQNPYRLVREIRGIGFATADALALKLGLARDAIERIRAGLSHALSEAATQGHCGLPADELTDSCAKLLGIGTERISEAITLELEAKRLTRDTLAGADAIFLPWLYNAEKDIGETLRRLVQGRPSWPEIDVEKALQWVEGKTKVHLAPSQRAAIELMLRSKVCVITGGPGVGKTTIVNSIVQIAAAKDAEVLLAAPTGRAARRLGESTGREAKTIHRLLEVNAQTGEFLRDESAPLECDLLVVDEASMIDVMLMQALVRALPPEAALLLVGDVDQLPAVGPGQVLADVIRSGAIPVVRLTEVFRQNAESRIVVSAHAINQGELPELSHRDGDFYFSNVKDGIAAAERIVDFVAERIPNRFGLDPLRDIQVLCPMRRSAAGVEALNVALQKRLNPRASQPEAARIERMGTAFHAGDKVMQTVNNYEKDVFNGDTGVIVTIDTENSKAIIDMDGRPIEYADDELDDLVLAYATTIHKSQGSEYPAVVIALTTQHTIMLQRNLVYTAVTRGKKLVVIVGQQSALRQAVTTANTRRRWTKLREWLQP
jgi:exodeoxyribonuclease V alpha subunit